MDTEQWIILVVAFVIFVIWGLLYAAYIRKTQSLNSILKDHEARKRMLELGLYYLMVGWQFRNISTGRLARVQSFDETKNIVVLKGNDKWRTEEFFRNWELSTETSKDIKSVLLETTD